MQEQWCWQFGYAKKDAIQVLPLSVKIKIINFIGKEKKCMLNLPIIYSKNKSIHEIVKKEKEILASFSASPQTANDTANALKNCRAVERQALSSLARDTHLQMQMPPNLSNFIEQ